MRHQTEKILKQKQREKRASSRMHGASLARALQLCQFLLRAIDVGFPSAAEREQLLLSLQISKRRFDLRLPALRNCTRRCFLCVYESRVRLGGFILCIFTRGRFSLSLHSLQTRLSEG